MQMTVLPICQENKLVSGGKDNLLKVGITQFK